MPNDESIEAIALSKRIKEFTLIQAHFLQLFGFDYTDWVDR